MKTLITLLLLVTVNAHAKVTKPKIHKCVTTKIDREIIVTCTDKTKTRVKEDDPTQVQQPVEPQTMHIKDANGTEYKNLLHITTGTTVNHLLLNKTTGHVLGYESTGNLSVISKTLYESTDCTGTMYATHNGSALKNRIFVSNAASSDGAEQFKITGYQPAYIALRSQYQAGVCTSLSASVNNLTVVAPVVADVADPVTLNFPLEIVWAK